MAIQINQAKAREMSAGFEEAMELIQNEFDGLDLEQQYRNAFARLLKPDPLERVLMMGTDQRDLFIPTLRTAIQRSVPEGGHVLDIGAGDGQTFALVADQVPTGTTVSFAEPNTHYVPDYQALIQRTPHLQEGIALCAGFEEIDERAELDRVSLPADGSIDLAMALHMIYFLEDLPSSLTRMARFLRPGGELFVVFADETEAYTGRSLHHFLQREGKDRVDKKQLAAIAERRRLLSSPEEGGGEIIEILHANLPGNEFTMQSIRQPSRLYGHSLSDMIAFSNIAFLSTVPDFKKYRAAFELLSQDPELVDLRIEEDGIRKGMWSVKQPQVVSVLRKEK